MKTGKSIDVLAIDMMCAYCNGPCIDPTGSYMLIIREIPQDVGVKCEDCGEYNKIPARYYK